MTNCHFQADGHLIAMFSLGRGRILEDALTVHERAQDLASLKEALDGAPDWEAVKLGYRANASDDVEEVLASVDAPAYPL
jgi:hypothetical protein